MDRENSVKDLQVIVKKFCEDRDWDQYHGAKDLAIGISTEAAEILEHFRFKSDKEVEDFLNDPAKKKEVSEELADVLFFILRFSQKYDIDLVSEFHQKLEKTGKKYPIEKSKGSNKKYTEL